MKEIRLLRADEIDCRIGSIKENGLTLLLYKDARVDMNILDETFGPYNWQRRHTRDNANCTVSIWDDEKKQWIEKEDTGTESNTEAQKGLASDSFKRACFNVGIGRELYTAPFIWIDKKDCNITSQGEGNRKRAVCYDRFRVTDIRYDENRNIVGLAIDNEKTHRRVFSFGMGRNTSQGQEAAQKPPEGEPQPQEAPDGYYYCNSCGKIIGGIRTGGKEYSPREVAVRALKKHEKQLCWDCQKKREMPTA